MVYSIVSSARSRAACGMTKPNDFAVLRFSTNSLLPQKRTREVQFGMSAKGSAALRK